MTDKVFKVAILGGSFDPVTKAHISMIENLSRKYSRVIVLPCHTSPFKLGGCSSSGEDRVEMIRLLTAQLENVKVSKWEIKRDSVSYTADAVRHYKEKYPQAELYFVIGSDCLAELDEWKEADYLARNVKFCLVRRPGYSVKKKVKDRLVSQGFQIVPAGFKGEDYSSSLVRAAVAFGKEKEFVPHEVAKYIREHSLYREYEPFVKAYSVFGLKPERIEHTFRAVKMGIRLCKIHGEDVNEAITALILHDIGKYADIKTLEEHKVAVADYDELKKVAPAVLHSHVSAAIARDYFKLNERIVSAIYKHTTASTQMSALDKIVYLADAVEEGRDYEGVESLRRLAVKDLDRAMLRSLKATIKNLKSENKSVFADTLEASKAFSQICKAKTAAAKAAPVFAQNADNRRENAINGNYITHSTDFSDLKNKDAKTRAEFIAAKLSEKKGRDIVIVDVAQKTVIADRFVIASAYSTTAVKAMADYVDEKLSKDYGIEPLRRDISPKWAALDYGDVIVHIQHVEAREFYRIDKLWDSGDNVTRYED